MISALLTSVKNHCYHGTSFAIEERHSSTFVDTAQGSKTVTLTDLDGEFLNDPSVHKSNMEYWRFHQPRAVNLRKIEAGANARTAIMLRNISKRVDLKGSKLFLDAIFKGGGPLRLLLPVHWLVSGRPPPSSDLDTLRQHQHILVSL